MPDYTDNEYVLGDPVGIENTFTPAPPSATSEVRKPSGVVITPTVTNAGGGRFTATVPSTDQQGIWWYSFIASTGAVDTGSFYVGPRRSQVGTTSDLLGDAALISLEEGREFVFNSPLDSHADDRLERRINEISAAVSAYTRREWKPLQVGQTRQFWYDGRGYLSLAPWDPSTITTITMYTNLPTASQVVLQNGTTLQQAEWYGHRHPILGTYQWLTMPTTYGSCQVNILGDWGIGTIPEDVKLAVKVALRNSMENPVGYQSSTAGPYQYSEAGVVEEAGRTGGNLPPEARALLTPYKRAGSRLAA